MRQVRYSIVIPIMPPSLIRKVASNSFRKINRRKKRNGRLHVMLTKNSLMNTVTLSLYIRRRQPMERLISMNLIEKWHREFCTVQRIKNRFSFAWQTMITGLTKPRLITRGTMIIMVLWEVVWDLVYLRKWWTCTLWKTVAGLLTIRTIRNMRGYLLMNIWDGRVTILTK